MIRARLTAATVLLLLCGAPGVAGAASGSSTVVLYGTGGGQIVRSYPVRVSGEITVDFHGDPATGCAARGVCGDSGWVMWQPPPGGSLETAASRARGHGTTSASLLFTGLGPGPSAAVTTASVSATGPSGTAAQCVDTAPGGWSVPLRPDARRRLVLRLSGAPLTSLLGNRCAGPRDAVALAGLPAAALTPSLLRRGGRVTFLATRTFAGGGFAGTTRSTVVIRIGPATRPGRASSGSPAHGRRYREVLLAYHVRLGGTTVVRFAASPLTAVCGPLGACGTTGSLTLTPRASATVQLWTYGPAAQSTTQILAGLTRRRGSAHAFGNVTWPAGGAVTSQTAGPFTACHDAEPLGGGILVLSVRHGTITAGYMASGAAGGTGALTECAGPAPAQGSPLAAGSAAWPGWAGPRSRTATIALRTVGGFTDSAYSGRVVPNLTVTLRRIGIRSRFVTLPGGFVP